MRILKQETDNAFKLVSVTLQFQTQDDLDVWETETTNNFCRVGDNALFTAQIQAVIDAVKGGQ